MKRFLSRSSNKTTAGQGDDTSASIGSDLPIVPLPSNQSGESHDSIKELGPMFRQQQNKQIADNDDSYDMMHLNLNPTILNLNKTVPSIKGSTIQDSLFSSRQSYSTNQSSYKTGGTNTSGGSSSNSQFGKRKHDLNTSQPLQTLKILEENEHQNLEELIRDNLKQLYQDLAYTMSQFYNSSASLSTTVINIIDCLKKFNIFVEKATIAKPNEQYIFTSYNSSSLRKILKIYLELYDNLLTDQVYIKLKLLLVKNFNDFAMLLNSQEMNQISEEMIKPKNYPIGSSKGKLLPNEEILVRIMEKVSHSNLSMKEQNGSFIAPITRGISNNLNILCLYFGYPEPTEYHHSLTQSLRELYDDVHVVLAKNQIELASATRVDAASTFNKPAAFNDGFPQLQAQNTQKFKLPFRVPTDIHHVPMSMSISIENATRTSGTMGGYIYPIIDLQKQPHLKSYANSKFAISCGHVCLDSDNPENYPNVSSPSSVLISLYKQALTEQYHKSLNRNNSTAGVPSETRVAFGAVLQQLEEMFPLKQIKKSSTRNNNSAYKDDYEVRNLPKYRFGQIIWGERTLIKLNGDTNGNSSNNHQINEMSGIVEKKLSDLAIIKVNKKLKCEHNYLGDDVQFNEYDPSLMFDNLYVRKVINLKRYVPKVINTAIEDVDSDVSNNSEIQTYFGIPVFKYGSTTKYTKGHLNGIKLVYWLDGAIHSSEFIVNSIEANSSFASGGDSGSWILTKLDDIEDNSKGLGVLGMLHSYDGEFKQFGLFTPMTEILLRLEEVTNIKWGVVGCDNKHDEEDDDELHGFDTDDNDDRHSAFLDDDDDDGVSENSDAAYPPDIE